MFTYKRITTSRIQGSGFRSDPFVAELLFNNRLGKNSFLQLRREPDNIKDTNAIMIFAGDHHLGYIEAGIAVSLAPMMADNSILARYMGNSMIEIIQKQAA